MNTTTTNTAATFSEIEAAKAVGAFFGIAANMSFADAVAELDCHPGQANIDAMIAQISDPGNAKLMADWFSGSAIRALIAH